MLVIEQQAIQRAGSALAKLAGGSLLTADVLNALLCAQDDPRLTDAEADAAQVLFDTLCDYRPEAVELAQQR